MNNDLIIEEIRENRRKVLENYNYDLDYYFQELYKKQQDNPEKYADLNKQEKESQLEN